MLLGAPATGPAGPGLATQCSGALMHRSAEASAAAASAAAFLARSADVRITVLVSFAAVMSCLHRAWRMGVVTPGTEVGTVTAMLWSRLQSW